MKNFAFELLQSTGGIWNGRTGLTVVLASGIVFISGTCALYYVRNRRREKTKDSDSVDRKVLRQAFADYNLNGDAGEETPFVKTFFETSGRFNEFGWGESFHSTVPLAGKSLKESESIHEARLASICQLRPSMHCLDVGCGIGGPMRTIAAFSACRITGIDFDDHRINRCEALNHRDGMQSLCSPVCVNMHDMKVFQNQTFDAAYAIETICYSPDAESVYREIFRVLKSGAIFASYELVKTPPFEATNADHSEIINEVAFGSGVADLRTAEEYIQAANRVGFEHVISYDVATESSINRPWYERLEKLLGRQSGISKMLLNFVKWVRLMSPEERRVHDMLVASGKAVVSAGKHGIMTPMHLIVLKKPTSNQN